MDKPLEVKYGWFVEWQHDLYGGIHYYGVFLSEKTAINYGNGLEGYDDINVSNLPYVEFNGNIIALWKEGACYNVGEVNDKV